MSRVLAMDPRQVSPDTALRHAFPDFHAEIHFQFARGGLVTTYKTYVHVPSNRSPRRRVGN